MIEEAQDSTIDRWRDMYDQQAKVRRVLNCIHGCRQHYIVR